MGNFEYFYWLCGADSYDWYGLSYWSLYFTASAAVLQDFVMFLKGLLRLIFVVVVFIACAAFLVVSEFLEGML